MVSSPKSPNPYQQASADQRAQSTASQQSAIINNPNEYNNYGSQEYSIAGWEKTIGADGKAQYTPRYNKTTKLSNDEQQIANQDTATRYNLGRTATDQSSKLNAYLNKGVDTSSWQPWATGHDFQEATDRPTIERNMMESYHRAADPQARAQEAQLANRGMSPGGQGYGTFQQGQLDAEGEAARQAYLASGNEARANYGTAASHWDQLNQVRQAQAQETFALRNQPINEIMALMGGSQVNMPSFSPFSRQGISAASPGGYQQQNYQNQMNYANNFNQGLFGLAGAGAQAGGYAFGKSDRRLKEAITPTGHRLAGLPVYTFTFRDHPALPLELRGVTTAGVMSDEARKLHPDTVRVDGNGFDEVNYAALFRRH